MNKYEVIGVMSGSSLDGLDVCLTTFSIVNDQWSFKIQQSTTFKLPDHLIASLKDSGNLALEDDVEHPGFPEVHPEDLYSFVSVPPTVNMLFLGFVDMGAKPFRVDELSY